MKIIVGLGNPGKNYESTRHNVGFRVVECIGTEFGAVFAAEKHMKAEVGKVTIAASQVLLVKPMTFMNMSGLSVGAASSWYKVQLEDFLIIHDDVSLPLGKLRFQKAGGAGGQHGVESNIETLGGKKNFNRLKVGVGPDPGGERRANYVLSPVPESDRSLYEEMVQKSAKAASFWVSQGIAEAMNQFNSTDLSAVSKPAPIKNDDPNDSMN